MRVKISIDAEEAKKVLKGFSENNFKAINKKFINIAVKEARKESVERIKSQYAIKPKDAKANVTAKPANQYKTEGTVTIRANPIGLEKFKLKQNNVGLAGIVDKTKGAALLPHAFFQTIKGKQKAFVRTKRLTTSTSPFVVKPSKLKEHTSKSGGQLPINRLLADPAATIISPQANDIIAVAQAKAMEALPDLINKAIDTGKV